MPSISDVNLRWRDGTLERMRSRFLERDGARGVECTTLLLVEISNPVSPSLRWRRSAKSSPLLRGRSLREQGASGNLRLRLGYEAMQRLPHFAEPSKEILRNPCYFDRLMRLLICGFSVRFRGGSPTFAHACQPRRELRLASHAKVVRRSLSEGGPRTPLFHQHSRTAPST